MVLEKRKLYTDKCGRKKHEVDHKNDFKRQEMDFIFYVEVDSEPVEGFTHGGYMSAGSGIIKNAEAK